MAKSFFETAPKSLFPPPPPLPPPVYQDLSTFHNWPVKKSRCRFASHVERKFETHWNLLEVQNKDLVAASPTLITRVRFRLRRMLGCVSSLRVVQVNDPFSFISPSAFICHESGAPCLAYVPGQQLLISGGRKGNICILGFLKKLCQSVNSVASFWSKVWPT